MIASKQIAFGKAAKGNKLPDGVVPIEYLESTGTQWIDTQYPMADIRRLEIDIDWSSHSTTRREIMGGGRYGSYSFEVNADGYYGLSNSIYSTIKAEKRDVLRWEYTVGVRPSLYVDGVFGCEDKLLRTPIGTFKTAIDTASATNSKIYGLKIYTDNDTLVRDLTPVRKGNIGYMYDRVSGQLFGNQDTGEFVLGPDIIDYTAKDYVQDGLVAMWDGIENAGWGVHDASATVWKELVTNTDSPGFDPEFSWESDCLNTEGGTRTSSALAPSGIFDFCEPGTAYSIEVVVKDYVNGDSIRTLFAPSGSTVSALQTYRRKGFEQIVADFNGDKYYYFGDGASSVVEGSHVFTMVCDGITPKVYLDGSYIAPQSGGTIGTKSPQKGSESYFAWLNPTLHSEKYCRISCYKSALTAEEIAYNYEIDKARFGL